MNLTVRQVAEVLQIRLPGTADDRVSGVSVDTRTLNKGMLFFALQGTTDGHAYVEEALNKGSCAAVVAKTWKPVSEIRGILLRVDEPLTALQNLTAWIRLRFEHPVIAITGSNGKTTTKEMTAAVLSSRFRVLKSPGNLNNHIGVPLSLCAWSGLEDVAVLELGTNHFGEIGKLCSLARPTHGLITNIGKAHLETFGSLEGVLKAKSELLDFLNGDGVAVLNADDPMLMKIRGRVKKCRTFGISNGELRGMDPQTDPGGLPAMSVEGIRIRLQVPGLHNLYNALAALAVGRELGLALPEMSEALNRFVPAKDRMQILSIHGVTLLNDTYNANPTSMATALGTLSAMGIQGRRVAVLGDMAELGAASEDEHRALGRKIAEIGFDAFFAYGPHMEGAVSEAIRCGLHEARHFTDRSALSSALQEYLRPGDGLCIKGSRSMEMERVVADLRKLRNP